MQVEIFVFLWAFVLFLIVFSILYSQAKREKFFEELSRLLSPYAQSINLNSGSWGRRYLQVILKPEYELERLVIELKTEHRGDSSYTYAALQGFSTPGTDYSLELKPQYIGFGLAKKFFGFTEVEIGDPIIDDKFIIQTNNVELTRRLFSDPTFRNLVLRISRIRKFKAIGGRYLQIYADTTYSVRDVFTLFQLIERFVALVAPEAKAHPIEYSPYDFTTEKAPLPEERVVLPNVPPPISQPRAHSVSYPASTLPKPEENVVREKPQTFPGPPEKIEVKGPPSNMEKPVSSSVSEVAVPQVASMSRMKQAFEDLRPVTSDIKFIPSPEHFTQVIVTPWISDVDQMKYELTDPMRVIGIENRHSSPSRPIFFSIRQRKKLTVEYPSLSELRNAVEIKASDKDLERDLKDKYELMRSVALLKGLRTLTVDYSTKQIKVVLDCDLDPDNVKFAYRAIKEAVLAVKFII